MPLTGEENPQFLLVNSRRNYQNEKSAIIRAALCRTVASTLALSCGTVHTSQGALQIVLNKRFGLKGVYKVSQKKHNDNVLTIKRSNMDGFSKNFMLAASKFPKFSFQTLFRVV